MIFAMLTSGFSLIVTDIIDIQILEDRQILDRKQAVTLGFLTKKIAPSITAANG